MRAALGSKVAKLRRLPVQNQLALREGVIIHRVLVQTDVEDEVARNSLLLWRLLHSQHALLRMQALGFQLVLDAPQLLSEGALLRGQPGGDDDANRLLGPLAYHGFDHVAHEAKLSAAYPAKFHAIQPHDEVLVLAGELAKLFNVTIMRQTYGGHPGRVNWVVASFHLLSGSLLLPDFSCRIHD